MTKDVAVYVDYKSPYAYLAVEPARALERDFDVRLLWRPYVLDIPSFLGAAQVDAAGNVLSEQRNAHQWRRVRYSYMDCRRYAGQRGLVIRGPRKIFDSSIAALGMLHALNQAGEVFRRYNDLVFERFWKRELDIEQPAVIAAVLAEAGGEADGFADFLAGPGRERLRGVMDAAHEQGVFGVPTFTVDDEIFWGREHLPLIETLLARR
ncbi:MAG: disulfide bond formation protein DsbA [Alphaproteobacteria bacterium]|nr:disulfide bond formation protein DsbA [Alphaproteobacteria bacterium]